VRLGPVVGHLVAFAFEGVLGAVDGETLLVQQATHLVRAELRTGGLGAVSRQAGAGPGREAVAELTRVGGDSLRQGVAEVRSGGRGAAGRWVGMQRSSLQLGLETVPVHVATGLTSPQLKAYRLADNQTAQLSQWDYDRLPLELAELQKLDFEMSLTGFSADELMHLLEPEGAKPTDQKLRAKDRPLANDFVSDAEFAHLLRLWFQNLARVLLPGRTAYIWGGYANVANYPPALQEAGLYFSQTLIWDKEHPVLTRKDFMGVHEWCFYSWKEGAAHQFFGPNNVTDLWRVKKVNPQRMIHLTEKPVELAVRALQYSSRVGENVLDLFGGSGSTLIAAEQTGRRCFLMELDPLYADVIVQRFEQVRHVPKPEPAAAAIAVPELAEAALGAAKVGSSRQQVKGHGQKLTLKQEVLIAAVEVWNRTTGQRVLSVPRDSIVQRDHRGMAFSPTTRRVRRQTGGRRKQCP
jgi:hypothetical protein